MFDFKQTKKFIYAVSTLAGTIIGVGFFALPYIASKVGIWVMLGYFLVLGSLVVLIHLFFGKLALQTPDYKRLPGFAKIHLGKWAEKLALLSTILGIYGAILAYIIVGGQFLESLLTPFFGGSNFVYTLLYWLVGALLIFFGIKAISQIEFWGLILFFSVLLLIFSQSTPFLKISNLLAKTGDFNDLFLPYGIILFSLWGASLIPETEEMLRGNKKLFKSVIIAATLIPIAVYLFFIFFILSVTGPNTTESALTGLKGFLGNKVLSLGFLFGIITTFTSYIALGLTLRNIFWYDLKIEKKFAWVFSCFIPLILFMLGAKSFIPAIGLVGGAALGIDGMLILLMYQKKTKKTWIYPLVLIFFLGIIYEIIYFIR